MNHWRSTPETPADRYVPAGHSGQIRDQEQYAGSSKGLALVPHRAQSLWRHHPCPGATAAPPDNFRNRQALPGQLTRTTGSPGGPAAARHGPRAELRSYPIPVLRPAGQSHPLQHDWLPRAEFWTARLARPIAAALQTRSHPRRVRQRIGDPQKRMLCAPKPTRPALATRVRNRRSVIVQANYNWPACHATRPRGALSFFESQELIVPAGVAAGYGYSRGSRAR